MIGKTNMDSLNHETMARILLSVLIKGLQLLDFELTLIS